MTARIISMQQSIKLSTAVGLGIYALLLGYLLAPAYIESQLSDLFAIANILPLLSLLLIAVASYLVMGDVHNLLDRRLYRGRRSVDDFIAQQLTQPCREARCPRALQHGILPQEERSLVNDLFLATLVPSDDTERERAFAYFTTYFTAVNLSTLSYLCAIVAVPVVILRSLGGPLHLITFLVVLLVLPVSFTLLRRTSASRLHHPPRAQTTRILANDSCRLTQLLPHYRLYTPSQSCESSGLCPLR